jgi:hypothetical protein
MKILYSLALFFCMQTVVLAQLSAVTEKGRAVILFGNGTWCYLNDSVKLSYSDLTHYSIPRDSRDYLKGKTIPYKLWYNSGEWDLLTDTLYKNADYSLKNIRRDLIAIVVTEKIEIPLQKLRETALDNFKKAGAECKVSEEQTITVNGMSGLLLKIDALVDGIPYAYLNCYFSTSQGTFQILTFTGYNLFDRYRKEMMDFISGFTLPGH